MAGEVNARLAKLGIEVPQLATPGGNYVGNVQVGNLVFISGQIPVEDGKVQFQGKVGDKWSLQEGQAAARLCAINVIAQIKAACGGDLDRLTRVVKLTGFVNSTSDFTDQPKVVNGASDLMVEVFGDKGKHSRSAVSTASLPFGVAVEVEAVVEIS